MLGSTPLGGTTFGGDVVDITTSVVLPRIDMPTFVFIDPRLATISVEQTTDDLVIEIYASTLLIDSSEG
jgi:hypothetical protein